MPGPGSPSFSLPARRVNFVWGRPAAAPAPWRLGLFCVFRLGKSALTGRPFVPKPAEAPLYPRAVLISLRGLLQWMAVLAVAAYFGGAGLIHARLAEDPFNRVRYRDLVAPWRWSSVPALRGAAMLERAKASYHERRIGEALYLLRAGLVHQPADGDARILLANAYVSFLRRDLAEAVVFEGLEKGAGGPEYLRKALALLVEADRPSRLIDFCRRARASVGVEGEALLVLDAAEAGALLELGRPREALDLLRPWSTADDPAIAQLRVRAALSLGDFDGAIEAASAWVQASPRSVEAMTVLVGALRAAGRFEEMEATMEKLRRQEATNVDIASLAVLENLRAGRRAEAAAAFDEIVLRFGSSPTRLARMAGALAEMGDLDFLNRLEGVFREHGFDPQQIWFNRLVALLAHADWEAGRELQQSLLARKAALSPAVRAFAETAAPLIEYCSAGTPAAKTALLEILVRHRGRLGLYLRISDALIAARRWEGARDVLLLAEGLYPRGRRIEERRSRIAPELEKIASEAQRREAVERRVSGGDGELATAEAFWAALEADVERRDPESALRRIAAARRQSPEWLSRSRARLELRELELAMETDDLPRLKMLAHDFLRDGEPERIEHVCGLIRDARAAGQGPVARVLLMEVLRRDPQSAARAGLAADPGAEESETL